MPSENNVTPLSLCKLFLMHCHARRWGDLDDSPVTWHICSMAGNVQTNGADVDTLTPEPWQSAVNGIY
jgi:hypothetical protein